VPWHIRPWRHLAAVLPKRCGVNREERLRAALAGTGLEDQAADLASLPAAQVGLIVSALKASGRAAVAADKAKRRQRVADRRKHHHIEDDQQAAATERQTLALARRASTNLETLARLKEHYDERDSVLALAVAGARAQGRSWGAIAEALGVTRQTAWERFHCQAGPDGEPAGTSGVSFH
jgi:hypothetical protein